ncbi:MAG: alpha/beta hydrolase [Polyangiaceae bacterium]|nr:alpha/beta hydrolase [Polyangiaceae bacterium]
MPKRPLRIMFLFTRAFWSAVFARLFGKSPWPGLGFQTEVLVRFLKLDWLGIREMAIPEAREDLASRPLPDTATKRVRVTPAEGAPVSSVWVEPTDAADDRVVLYLHGGSYLFGSHETHADTLARVALGARARLLAPNYRLAPEHPYPAQLDDAVATYEWLVKRVEPKKITVAGESAGANLVIALMIALRDRGIPLPAGAAAISAWVDLESTRPSITKNEPTDFGDRDMLIGHARLFAGDVPLSDPRVSPLFADLHGLPPLFVQAGDAECLFDENSELVERVRKAGGRAELDRVPGHPHAPLFFAEWSKEAQASVDRLGAWIRRTTP